MPPVAESLSTTVVLVPLVSVGWCLLIVKSAVLATFLSGHLIGAKRKLPFTVC